MQIKLFCLYIFSNMSKLFIMKQLTQFATSIALLALAVLPSQAAFSSM